MAISQLFLLLICAIVLDFVNCNGSIELTKCPATASTENHLNAKFKSEDAKQFVQLLYNNQVDQTGQQHLFSDGFQTLLDQFRHGVFEEIEKSKLHSEKIAKGAMYLLGAYLLEMLLDYAELDESVVRQMSAGVKSFWSTLRKQTDRNHLEDILDTFEAKVEQAFRLHKRHMGAIERLVQHFADHATFGVAMKDRHLGAFLLRENDEQEEQREQQKFEESHSSIEEIAKKNFEKTDMILQSLCDTINAAHSDQALAAHSRDALRCYARTHFGAFQCRHATALRDKLARALVHFRAEKHHRIWMHALLAWLRDETLHSVMRFAHAERNGEDPHEEGGWRGVKMHVAWTAKKLLKADIYLWLKRHLIQPMFTLLGWLPDLWLKRSILEMALCELGLALWTMLGHDASVEKLELDKQMSLRHHIFHHHRTQFEERVHQLFNTVAAGLAQQQRALLERHWKLMENYYSSHLQSIQFPGDICAYLNITKTTKFDVENLTAKFDALDKIGTIWPPIGWLIQPMVHQLIVAKCAFLFKVQQMASDFYHDFVLVYYTDKYGFFSPITPWVILPSIVVLLSVLFNISLIVVTVSKLKDHKTCNWLLALDSLFQIISVSPFLLNFSGVLFNFHPIDYRICLGTLMVSTVASFASFMAIYLISLERLLIVSAPLKMKRWTSKSKVRKHSLTAAFICTIFGLVMNWTVFNVWTITNLPYKEFLYCNSGLYSDVLNTTVCYVVILLCVLNYAIIFGIILAGHLKTRNTKPNQQSDSNADKSMRRMLRSVFILLSVVLIGWLVASSCRNLITDPIGPKGSLLPAFAAALAPDNKTEQDRIVNNINVWLIGVITCVPLIASGSGPVILFFSSDEYRDAYKRMVKPKHTAVGSLFNNNNEVVNTNQLRNNQNQQQQNNRVRNN